VFDLATALREDNSLAMMNLLSPTAHSVTTIVVQKPRIEKVATLQYYLRYGFKRPFLHMYTCHAMTVVKRGFKINVHINIYLSHYDAYKGLKMRNSLGKN
jgi:hypothetical protein